MAIEIKEPIAEQLRHGRRRQGSELTAGDVGRRLTYLEGFGPVQSGDVGKRVWLKEHGFVMENVEQRDRRMATQRSEVPEPTVLVRLSWKDLHDLISALDQMPDKQRNLKELTSRLHDSGREVGRKS